MDTRSVAVDGKPEDIRQLSVVLKRAFESDPFHRWILRSNRAQRFGSHKLFASVLAVAISHAKLLTTPELAGAAIWLPPSYQSTAIARLKAFGLLAFYSGVRLPTILEGFNQQDQHKPDQAHWYLYAIGTDPEHQGRGVGTALIMPMLQLCDQQGLAAHLDTCTEANVQYYEGRGFQITSEFDFPDGPHCWGMTRPSL
jgi:ribosomal protein S18 acetylase RimI-like enzyme